MCVRFQVKIHPLKHISRVQYSNGDHCHQAASALQNQLSCITKTLYLLTGISHLLPQAPPPPLATSFLLLALLTLTVSNFTQKREHALCPFLWLTYVPQHRGLEVHLCFRKGRVSFIFKGKEYSYVEIERESTFPYPLILLDI